MSSAKDESPKPFIRIVIRTLPDTSTGSSVKNTVRTLNRSGVEFVVKQQQCGMMLEIKTILFFLHTTESVNLEFQHKRIGRIADLIIRKHIFPLSSVPVIAAPYIIANMHQRSV